MSREPRRSDNAPINVYLREISRIPDLAPDELNHQLRELDRLRGEDPAAWRVVKDRVVLHHLRLVVGFARRFHYGSIPLMDLIQEGNLGLMRAAERFDVSRGVLFSTYAPWWIRRNVWRALENQSHTIRLPNGAWTLERRARRLEEEARLRRNEKLSAEEIAEALDSSPTRVDRLRALAGGLISYDLQTEEGSTPFGETLADPNAARPDEVLEESWLRRAFTRGLANVDERARRVLALRWGLGGTAPLTLAQTGQRFGITGARVCQIEKAAIERLRHCPILREVAGVEAEAFSSTPR